MCCDGPVSDTNPGTDPALLREVAEQLATEAAEFVRRRRAEVFGQGPSGTDGLGGAVRVKSSSTDPVTVVDTETERLLRDRLAALRPGDAILGEEEGGAVGVAPGQLTWVLDPIDGTVNFLYGIPAYAVSVGVRRDGASVAGAVADVAAGEVYSAALGGGARVRRGDVVTELRCSSAADLSTALVGTGFSYDRAHRRRQGEIIAELLPQVRDLRRIGSCALDLCSVAAGRLDAYFEDDVHVWDWAAAALIAAEAGAHVRPPESTQGGGRMVAAAPGIREQLEAALARAGALDA
ncbi:inositol monophosphatase family protein [Mycolicibacterium parafortuitum]|uniref:Inositol-1-monophosphatase n=1 Tax=Mycolicibacterium parafortuitum TaxID=39692 RepID=A0A375YK97_MYCPF|nr:inositol monophosphatase family protein [Mycolicibacterium parafortuitum]ORB26630.1 inositol monophosphatase [Mycolicibacterium parafortuitum]SRX81560.1 inositol monophosphatase [Tsukamurella paurometabola DSM] [Mycolicibacterium parafortuitum]